MYKNNDLHFEDKVSYQNKFDEFFELLSGDLFELKETFMMKSYAAHSLFCALMHRKYGLPCSTAGYVLPTAHKGENNHEGTFFRDAKKAAEKLQAMALAHETQDIDGEFREYVIACITTTHGQKHRYIRTKCILEALDA